MFLVESVSDTFSEASLFQEGSDEDTVKCILRTVFGIIFIVFFLIYGMCMFFIPFAYDKESPDNDDVFELEKDKSLIALHFLTMIFAIIFGVLLLFFSFNLLVHGIILLIFVIFWIAYMAVFFTSDTFKYITAYNSPFQNVYSYQQYKDFWSDWSKTNPNVVLKYHDENTSYVCQSASFTFLSTASVNKNDNPTDINIDDETGRNPAMFIIKINLEVEWKPESVEKIAQLENKMKSCYAKPSDTKITIVKDNSLPELSYSLFITEDGKLPPKFRSKNVILFGIFWAGVRSNFDLRSVSFKTDTIKKGNAVISDESIGTFNCDQMNLQCWSRAYQAECFAQSKSTQGLKAAGESAGYSRERLSRAFYLSDAAYGHFDYFENENEKKIYTWSKPLLETFIKKSTINGFCYPHYYVGRYKNEIWIAVRGSHSLYDWITDGNALSKTLISGNYHQGFYQAGINIWRDIAEIFIDQQYQDCTFYFAGHSYGGAVANVLHKLASHCFPELQNRMYSFTFGAPPAMGEKTSENIKDHIYSYVNGHDIVPRLSINTGKRIVLLATALLTAASNSEQMSRETMKTIENSLKEVATDGFKDDKISRPIGNIYHLTYRKWKKDGSLKIEDSKTTNFLKIPFINLFGAGDHSIKNYATKFMKYSDALMKPQEFDANVVIKGKNTFRSNLTIFELLNIDDPAQYFNSTHFL